MDLAIGVAIGVVAGLIGGMLGVGGGITIVPGAVIFLGTDQTTAQGVSLAAIVVTSAVGAMTHYRQRTMRAELVPWIAPMAVVASVVAAWAAGLVDPTWLRRAFAILLVLFGTRMIVSRPSAEREEVVSTG